MTIMIYVYLCMYFHGMNFFERHIFRSLPAGSPTIISGGWSATLEEKRAGEWGEIHPEVEQNQYMFSWQLNKYTMRSYIWNCQLCLYREVRYAVLIHIRYACERAGRSIQVMMSWTLAFPVWFCPRHPNSQPDTR